MMHLVLFESDPNQLPTDLNERKKLWREQVKFFKEEIKQGEVMAMGISPDNYNGFILTNNSAKELLAKRMNRAMGPSKSKTLPMLSLEEVEEILE